MTTKNITNNISLAFEQVSIGFHFFIRILNKLFFLFICALTLGTFLFCIAMIVGIWGLATDGVGVETYTKSVTVISKKHSGRHTDTQILLVGKTTMISSTDNEASWSAVVTDGTNTMTCKTTQEKFNTIKKDSVVDAQLYLGKHSNTVQCKSL